MPPRIEAQVWQLPITTLNPAKADMYMFMLEQEFPGPREARAARANADGSLRWLRRSWTRSGSGSLERSGVHT